MLRGKIVIDFSTNSILPVGDLTEAIRRLAPHLVDNVTVTETYVNQEEMVQWAIDNFEDLKVKHNRTFAGKGIGRVQLARLIKDEHPGLELKEIVDAIRKHGQY